MMTHDVIKEVCDERGLPGTVCGRCAKWGNEHGDEGRPVYTLKCDKGCYTPMDGSCPEFTEG